MSNLSTIPGIGKSSLDLLEAAGLLNVEALALANPEDLSRELERANDVLHIAKKAPARRSVEKWIDAAREMTVEPPAASVNTAAEDEPADHEPDDEITTLLATAPFAIPLPARYLMENQVSVGDIPPALLLSSYSGDLEVRVGEMASTSSPADPRKSFAPIGLAPRPATELGPLPRVSPENDRVALIRTPLEKTNRGRNPRSRRYVRGVLHSHPHAMTFGAIVTLVLAVVLPLAILSAGLLLLSDQVPSRFDWVPKWILVFPIALPILGLAYAIWGAGSSCRICGQKLFMPKACLKNLKAHHIPGLGHIVPVCLHILLFRWFRCTFCGTAIRLKK